MVSAPTVCVYDFLLCRRSFTAVWQRKPVTSTGTLRWWQLCCHSRRLFHTSAAVHSIDSSSPVASLMSWTWMLTSSTGRLLPVPWHKGTLLIICSPSQHCDVQYLMFILRILVWLGGVVVTASDCRSKGHRFNSQLFHHQETILASCSHTCASVTKQLFGLEPA